MGNKIAVLFISIGILFTGSSLSAQTKETGVTTPMAATPEVMTQKSSTPRGGKFMTVEFTTNVETGEVIKESVKVYEVRDGKKVLVKGIPAEKITFYGKSITFIPDYTMIRTHSSPGCQIWCVGGYCFPVCN
jgi:hypothetical protein